MGILNFFYGNNNKQKDEVETKTVNTVVIQEQSRGTSGTEVFAGYYDEEYLEKLKGTDRAKLFDRMRRSDAQVKMLLSSVKNPIKDATREINAASDDADHIKHAEVCKQVLFKDIKFNKFLGEALGLIDFGHSVFEKVHKINVDKPITDDNGNLVINTYIGLKKLGWRNQKTIETWNYNEDKDFTGITQQADGDLDVYVDIPKEHLIIMTLEQEGDLLEGISMLRPCYGNYFRKNEYLKLNAIGIEKSMPIPTAEVPSGKENTAQFTQLVAALTAFTTHQKNYLIYPAGWNVQLNNGTAYDPSKVEQSIDNEDKRMAKAFLANFLELGMGGGGGAYALSNDLSDFFLSGLMIFAGIIKEAMDELCEEITILNFGEQDRYPTFEFSGIKDKAGEEFAKILDLMVKSKIIVPDDNLEKHVRKRIGVTEISEEGQREIQPQPEPVMFSENNKLQEPSDHIHIDSNGNKTGPGVRSGDGHYHLLSNGKKTSVDPNNPTHTHTEPGGGLTGRPVKAGKLSELTLSEKIGFAIKEKRKMLGDE